ncbi:MAG: class I SAM-dependent methyltransferase, partial [Actinobacteria bacterium]|nr:class I SAM-dependent methyltransferase [Actinomycetota bacterium]
RLTKMHSPDRLLWRSCVRCRTWVLLPKEKTEVYPANYYGGLAAKFSGWAQDFRARFHRERARIVRKESNQRNGRIYDVGCGDGLFLKEASRLGFRIAGFEPEPMPRRQAEKRLGKHLDQTLFASLKSEKALAITCWQVIEHLDDPCSFLLACRHHLADGGLLTLSTVNLGSLQAKCFGGKWLHLDPPRHLWIGNLQRVIQLVRDSGFEIEKVRYNSSEFGPVGWVDSLFNLVDTKRDRLLVCLKQGCSEPLDWLAYILSAALAPVALLLSLLEAGLNKPATFEIYARLKKDRARRQGG